MKLQQFQDALFELVDLWTETTDPMEYVEFLTVLLAEHKAGRTLDEGTLNSLSYRPQVQRW